MSEPLNAPGPRRWCRRLLLIGWDGADWKMIEPLVERGEMPNMARFIAEGVMGNVATLMPPISPLLWTSIATGKHADRHNILGFAEPDPSGGKPRPVTSASRTCKAIWNIISDAGLQAGVVNWYASHPAEPIDGFVVSDRFPYAVGPPDEAWPVVPGSVHPVELLAPASDLRIHPRKITPAQLQELLPTLGAWDLSEDKHVAKLCTLLAECASVHTVATWLMQERDWDFCTIYYPLIDRLAHEFMEFHPPRMEHVSDEEFERFKGVMQGCYRFHDMMLGRLMDLAGDDATIIIVSDHGFHCDERRPAGSSSIADRPLAWHRPYGVLAIRGPQIGKDERVYGASLLDIAPTVLMLLGLPVADDMDGNALRQILDVDQEEVVIGHIDTHETVGGGSSNPASEEEAWVAEQMLRRLADLG